MPLRQLLIPHGPAHGMHVKACNAIPLLLLQSHASPALPDMACDTRLLIGWLEEKALGSLMKRALRTAGLRVIRSKRSTCHCHSVRLQQKVQSNSCLLGKSRHPKSL